MKKLIVITTSLLLAATVSAGGIVRCVNPDTGAVAYTDGVCSHGAGEKMNISSGNVLDSNQVHRDIQRLDNIEAEKEARRRENQRRMNSLQRRQAQQRSSEQQRKLCERIARPHKGSQNGQLTAAQMNSMLSCAGVSVPAPSTPASIPSAPRPSNITNCDPGGCWDNLGNRYNKGAGTTYFPPQGGACQLIGSQMQCP